MQGACCATLAGRGGETHLPGRCLMAEREKRRMRLLAKGTRLTRARNADARGTRRSLGRPIFTKDLTNRGARVERGECRVLSNR